MGTRYGCGLEQCGACTVLVDGEPVFACTRETGTVAGRSVTTIEGLGTPDKLHPLQQAFLDEQAGQCGYCLSGIILSAKALLDSNPKPSRAQIVEALDRHLCRCGTHQRSIRAVEGATPMLQQGVACTRPTCRPAWSTIRGSTAGSISIRTARCASPRARSRSARVSSRR